MNGNATRPGLAGLTHPGRTVSGFVTLMFLLLVLSGSSANAEEISTDAPQSADPQSTEEIVDPEAAAESYPKNTFRLFSRRGIGLRARPNVGVRFLSLEPVFSPLTADFEGRDRVSGPPLYAVAASLTLFSADGERESAKAQEFRDFDDHVAVGVDAQARGETHWLRLTGRHLLLDDQDARLELRRFGFLAAALDYSQIPHNYAFDARSLYSGIGTGVLEIDDTIQETLAGSTSSIEGAALLRDFVDSSASRVNLGHRRDRVAFELDLTAFDPLAFELVVKDEKRQGTRPWSASFGLANVVEIPWPVDYDTREVRLSAEYAKGKTLLRGEYRRSEFDNNIDTVSFDNPWRVSDSQRFPALTSTFEEGPALGLIDLYPSNEQHDVTLTFIRRQLPAKSNLFVTASWGSLEQDDPLVPYTTNTAVVPGTPGRPPFDFTDPANLPATSADARFDTRLLHARFTMQPTDALRIKAHVRDYELDNESAQIVIPGFVPEDAYYRPSGTENGFTNLPIAEAKTEIGVDFAFRLKSGARLSFGYENETIDREFREVEESEEDRFEISFDAKPAPWADLKVSYQIAEREAEEYDFAQFFRNQGIEFIPVLSFLRKFDQANRDRDRLQLIANFFPSERWTVGGQIILGEDDYPDSSFGVLNDEHEVYAVDLTYAASERVSLFASYSFETYEVAIAGREWIAFGPGDPFRTEPDPESASNWSADTEDEINSLVFALDAELIPDRLRLDLSCTWSQSDGRIAYASPIGEVDNSPFELADLERVDDVTWYNFNPELTYSFGARLSLSLAYLRERYEILDFNSDGFELVPVTPEGEFNGGLFMGTLPVDFDLDIFYLQLKLEL